jgi:hypothetical protein
LSTDVTTARLYVGGPILSGFICHLTEDDTMPTLDALAVFNAYVMAKKFNININHGFNLELAAKLWKKWCAPRHCTTTRRAGTSHAMRI